MRSLKDYFEPLPLPGENGKILDMREDYLLRKGGFRDIPPGSIDDSRKISDLGLSSRLLKY